MYPIVNFQKKNKDAHENLLDYVKEYLAKDQGYKKPEEKKKQKDKDNEQRNQQSFQVYIYNSTLKATPAFKWH